MPIAEQTEEDWDRTIDINLKGVWLCLKFEIRQMLKQGGGGAIVNMSSVAGLMGAANCGHVLRQQARRDRTDEIRRARECANNGIRINAVCPGGDRNGDG